jgi:hypothetical protein
MNNENCKFYITFDTYEEAMAMHDDLDKSSISNKISPAPLDLVEGVCCGVSLMIEPEDKDKIDKYLSDTKLKYLKLLKAERTFKPKRDRYC